MRKNNNGREWRLSYIKGREDEFEYWLAEQGAEIKTDYRSGEVFKFIISGKHGFLYQTMRCNKVYNDYAFKFRRSSK